MDDCLLTPKETAELLRVAPKTLEKWRSKSYGPDKIIPEGGLVGPPFVRMGSMVRYRRRDLLLWLESQTAR